MLEEGEKFIGVAKKPVDLFSSLTFSRGCSILQSHRAWGSSSSIPCRTSTLECNPSNRSRFQCCTFPRDIWRGQTRGRGKQILQGRPCS